jgi:hypothetical protein
VSSEPAFPYRHRKSVGRRPGFSVLCQNRLRDAPSLLGDGEGTFRSNIFVCTQNKRGASYETRLRVNPECQATLGYC